MMNSAPTYSLLKDRDMLKIQLKHANIKINDLKTKVDEYKSEFNKFEIAVDLILTELKKYDKETADVISQFWKALK